MYANSYVNEAKQHFSKDRPMVNEIILTNKDLLFQICQSVLNKRLHFGSHLFVQIAATCHTDEHNIYNQKILSTYLVHLCFSWKHHRWYISPSLRLKGSVRERVSSEKATSLHNHFIWYAPKVENFEKKNMSTVLTYAA